MVEPLTRGVASHHAGLLPAWKTLTEGLFQRGVLKIVFATETLAAGINMPARTVVLSSLSKRGDDGHALLTTNSMLQVNASFVFQPQWRAVVGAFGQLGAAHPVRCLSSVYHSVYH
jgi:hypothetical protein